MKPFLIVLTIIGFVLIGMGAYMLSGPMTAEQKCQEEVNKQREQDEQYALASYKNGQATTGINPATREAWTPEETYQEKRKKIAEKFSKINCQ